MPPSLGRRLEVLRKVVVSVCLVVVLAQMRLSTLCLLLACTTMLDALRWFVARYYFRCFEAEVGEAFFAHRAQTVPAALAAEFEGAFGDEVLQVVDVGCGRGGVATHALAAQGFQTLGLDPQGAAVEAAIASAAHLPESERPEFRLGSCSALPLEDESARPGAHLFGYRQTRAMSGPGGGGLGAGAAARATPHAGRRRGHV
jgi:hypothetical protein